MNTKSSKELRDDSHEISKIQIIICNYSFNLMKFCQVSCIHSFISENSIDREIFLGFESFLIILQQFLFHVPEQVYKAFQMKLQLCEFSIYFSLLLRFSNHIAIYILLSDRMVKIFLPKGTIPSFAMHLFHSFHVIFRNYESFCRFFYELLRRRYTRYQIGRRYREHLLLDVVEVGKEHQNSRKSSQPNCLQAFLRN